MYCNYLKGWKDEMDLRAFNIFQVYQYFTIYRQYLLLKQVSWISYTTGGTKDHSRQYLVLPFIERPGICKSLSLCLLTPRISFHCLQDHRLFLPTISLRFKFSQANIDIHSIYQVMKFTSTNFVLTLEKHPNKPWYLINMAFSLHTGYLLIRRILYSDCVE